MLVADELNVFPSECLTIEDSVPGLKAALTAGLRCLAVTTDFTRKSVHASGLLEDRWIVDDLTKLRTVADEAISLGSST